AWASPEAAPAEVAPAAPEPADGSWAESWGPAEGAPSSPASPSQAPPAFPPRPAGLAETQVIDTSGIEAPNGTGSHGTAEGTGETMVVDSAAIPAPPAPIAGGELNFETGPDSGHVFRLTGAAVRLGRAADNELILRDPATSGHHARVERRGDRYHIVDLGSTNGTLVNGQQVQERQLEDGDRITIGQNAVKFSAL
ncbi:MAG: FHA domain-containing protein, partial [Candidatus Dormibacterales bacterium]